MKGDHPDKPQPVPLKKPLSRIAVTPRREPE